MSKVYVFNISNYGIDTKQLEKQLSRQIVDFASKYKNKDDYLRSIIGWYLLTKYLKEDFSINLNNKKVFLNDKGKPYIDDKIQFNITHCHNLVSIIISNGECGVDIEICSKQRNWDNLKENILSKAERDNIKDNREIIKYWSIKEAYFKKLGIGIVLSKFRENIDYSKVVTILLNDFDNNDYFLSYVSDDENKCIVQMVDSL